MRVHEQILEGWPPSPSRRFRLSLLILVLSLSSLILCIVTKIHHTKMSTTDTPKGLLLKADPIAQAFRSEIQSAIASSDRPCKLVGILSTAAAPSKFYAEFTQRQCIELGVEFVLKKTGSALDEGLADGEGVEEAIIEANEDDSVDGIMVWFWSCSWAVRSLLTGLCA